jgi:hypothetical protein
MAHRAHVKALLHERERLIGEDAVVCGLARMFSMALARANQLKASGATENVAILLANAQLIVDRCALEIRLRATPEHDGHANNLVVEMRAELDAVLVADASDRTASSSPTA